MAENNINIISENNKSNENNNNINNNNENNKEIENTNSIFQKIKKSEYSDSIKETLESLLKLKIENDNLEDNKMEKELFELTNNYNLLFNDLEKKSNSIINCENLLNLSQKDKNDYNITEKMIKKSTKSIKNFWLNVLKNSKNFFISKTDEEILKNLKNIEINNLKDGLNFNVTFIFNQNKYFSNEKIIKKYFFDKKSKECINVESTKIKWNNNNIKKQKSFFDIFNNKGNSEEILYFQANEGEFFKNNIVPFSLEYYLNIKKN